MWTVEVHDQCMEQAIEDEQALAKARKYGNSIPRHNCQGSSISVIVALVSAGLVIANHARAGPRSLLARICKRVWDDGKQKEDTAASKRRKAAAAAEARQQEEASKGSRFNFPASGSGVTASTSSRVGATASTSRVTATAVDQSFTKEAAAVVAKTSGKSNKKKSKKNKKR